MLAVRWSSNNISQSSSLLESSYIVIKIKVRVNQSVVI